MFGDLFNFSARLVGSIVGIPIGTIAAALGVSERLVRKAVAAGCTTAEEVREWIEENT